VVLFQTLKYESVSGSYPCFSFKANCSGRQLFFRSPLQIEWKFRILFKLSENRSTRKSVVKACLFRVFRVFSGCNIQIESLCDRLRFPCYRIPGDFKRIFASQMVFIFLSCVCLRIDILEIHVFWVLKN